MGTERDDEDVTSDEVQATQDETVGNEDSSFASVRPPDEYPESQVSYTPQQQEEKSPSGTSVMSIPGGSGNPQADADAVKNILAARYGSAAEDQAKLKAAQETSNKNQLYANLGSAFNSVAHGIAGSQQPVNDKPFEELSAQSQQPVTQLQQQIAMRNQNDQGVRDWLMKKYGIDQKAATATAGQQAADKRNAATNTSRITAAGIAGDRFEKRIDTQEGLAAQRQSMNAEKQFQPRLEGASRIQGIWKKIESGEIKNNQAAKSLILSEIQRLETGASNPALEGQTQKDMSTMSQKLKEVLQNWSGEAGDTVPPSITKDIKNISNELSSSYMDQADSAYEVMKGSALSDNQKDVFDRRQKALQATYKKRFGYWGKQPSLVPPKNGEVQDGHVYNGGDPGNPNSWSQVPLPPGR